MKKIIISILFIYTNLLLFSQNDKILYNAGLDLSLSLNTQAFKNQNIKISPSAKLLGFFSMTFPKSIYLEVFGSPNFVEVDNAKINIFEDYGLLAGVNININSNSFNVGFGGYYRNNDKYNLFQNGYRFGLTGKIKAEFQLWKALSAGFVFRPFLDLAKNEKFTNKQLLLAQTTLGFSINSNLNEIFKLLKKNKKDKNIEYY